MRMIRSSIFGSLAMLAFDWRAIFVLMVIYGGVLLVAVHRFLPETNRTPDPARARPSGLLRAYAALAGDSRFLFPALMMGLVFGGFYSLSSTLPFLLIDTAGAYLCTTVFYLAEGALVMIGRQEVEPAPSLWVITGGTGAYLGARGEATAIPVEQRARFRYAITLAD